MRAVWHTDEIVECSSHPIWQTAATTFPVKYGRAVIERILPYRQPMLLLDTITHVDLHQVGLRAQRRIDPQDPVFGGHLPGHPIYPAALLLEVVVQAARCLLYFHRAGAPTVGARQLEWSEDRLVVHWACFPSTVYPGDGVIVLVKLLAAEAGAYRFAGQVLRNDDVCAAVVIEIGSGDPACTTAPDGSSIALEERGIGE
jgi:3-hydroxyacyl-[acyl-carrier-protein] dehydratase